MTDLQAEKKLVLDYFNEIGMIIDNYIKKSKKF